MRVDEYWKRFWVPQPCPNQFNVVPARPMAPDPNLMK
jgi:hypothetical protein